MHYAYIHTSMYQAISNLHAKLEGEDSFRLLHSNYTNKLLLKHYRDPMLRHKKSSKI